MNEQFVKRLKSFAWRTGMMVFAFLVEAVLENLSMLELNAYWTLGLGLVLGELSKYLNTKK